MPNASYSVLIRNIYLNSCQLELPLWSKQDYIDATLDTNSEIYSYFLCISYHAKYFLWLSNLVPLLPFHVNTIILFL